MKKMLLAAGALGAAPVLTAGCLVMVMAGADPAPTDDLTNAVACAADTSSTAGTGATSINALDARQSANAQAIIGTAKALGINEQGMVVAIATTLVESHLLNLASTRNPASLQFPHDAVAPGDLDSVGLFQQRDPWGSVADRMDPAQTAALFFNRLGQIPGWETMPVWQAAQRVQVSAFPLRYATQESLARATVAQLVGTTAAHAPQTRVDALYVGDSLAVGTGPALQANGAVSNVDAQIGRTTVAGLAVLHAQSALPSLIVVDLGTNDAADPNAFTARVIDALTLAGPTRRVAWITTHRPGWEALNDALRQIAATHPNLSVIDAAAAVRQHPQWLGPDQLQLTPDGYQGRAQVIELGLNATGSGPCAQQATTEPGSVVAGAWTTPIAQGQYRLTARFNDAGTRWAHNHTGLDFAGPAGTPIQAAAAGTVLFCGDGGAYGQHLIKLDNGGGIQTWYAHGSACAAPVGSHVDAGQRIGTRANEGNSTGAHTHFEVRQNGKPIDPEIFLKQHGVTP